MEAMQPIIFRKSEDFSSNRDALTKLLDRPDVQQVLKPSESGNMESYIQYSPQDISDTELDTYIFIVRSKDNKPYRFSIADVFGICSANNSADYHADRVNLNNQIFFTISDGTAAIISYLANKRYFLCASAAEYETKLNVILQKHVKKELKELEIVTKQKNDYQKVQDYENAAKARDKEKRLLIKIGEAKEKYGSDLKKKYKIPKKVL